MSNEQELDELDDYLYKDYLCHYGTPRHSGRYPWGSGKNPQRNKNLYLRAKQLKDQGMTEAQIAQGWGMTITEYRKLYSNGRAEVREANRMRALELEEKGYSRPKIAEIMGLPGESSVRTLLDENRAARTTLTRETADVLKGYVDENRYVDITEGSQLYLGVPKNRLDNAVALLKSEGYQELKVQYDQLGTNHKTTMKVLCPDDVTYQELKDNKYLIKTIGVEKVYDEDGSLSKLGLDGGFKSVDSSRIFVRYNEDGGVDKDGTIELRQGVKDISLGDARYAQVRIAVDDKYYMKGMALYGDVPDGYDIVYNSNKHRGAPMDKVFKPMQTIDADGKIIDMENPFGATIKPTDKLVRAQRYYTDENGKKQLSCINIVNEEGDWDKWNPTLASQFLSKQDWKLAKRQLDLTYANQKAEFDDICNLTNPTVKRSLLESFSDDCDAAAVHLKAAGLPRQGSRVILPFSDLKENEVYAPRLDEGQEVILVRYPHAGTFEIPKLKVHNKGTQADKVIHDAMDAIGINHKVAAQLSGADFDGDTVMMIPVDSKTRIKTKAAIKDLQEFEPKELYKLPDSAPKMSDQTKQTEMGKVSNLITDMTLQGADTDQLIRAVKHSMVVIDAQKHHLDYKKSEKDFGIAELKATYQKEGGASTLISRAKSQAHPLDRKERYDIDPETGRKVWKPTGDSRTTAKLKSTGEEVNVYKDKLGREYYFKTDPKTGEKERTRTYSDGNDLKNKKTTMATVKSTKMYETEDAYTLTSGGSKENPGTRMEAIYAEYANSMKALGNAARKELLNTGRIEYNPEARKEYDAEVRSLDQKLNNAMRNAPRERQAQLAANSEVEARLRSNPEMSDDRLKKVKSQALSAARTRYGAKAEPITLTDREWEAIQKGALHDSKLSKILQKCDQTEIRQRATPRAAQAIPPAKKQRALNMKEYGHTTGEIARALGLTDKQVVNILYNEEVA